jgi:5-formyltetrahydrofolate cyclo-ligase
MSGDHPTDLATAERMESDESAQERILKKDLRRQALARRDALAIEWRIEASLAMAEAAANIGFDPGTIVSGFWPIRSEADIRPAMFSMREQGARLALPVVLDKTTIVFRELVRGAALVDTGFGTAGPGEEAEVLDPQIMLVPLAAFDRRGHRIGYGAGHYDRAIAKLHDMGMRPRLIGVAFDCQEVPLVPNEWHDVMLSDVLTESGLRSFAPFPYKTT